MKKGVKPESRQHPKPCESFDPVVTMTRGQRPIATLDAKLKRAGLIIAVESDPKRADHAARLQMSPSADIPLRGTQRMIPQERGLQCAAIPSRPLGFTVDDELFGKTRNSLKRTA